MLIGRYLLRESEASVQTLTHINFDDIKAKLEKRFTDYHKRAFDDIEQALKDCYGDRLISLQQLSATFRRGDLLENLKEIRG